MRMEEGVAELRSPVCLLEKVKVVLRKATLTMNDARRIGAKKDGVTVI